MTERLRRVVAELERLPEAEQDEIAGRLLEELEQREWDALVGSPASLHLLRRLAAEARAEHERGETRNLDELL